MRESSYSQYWVEDLHDRGKLKYRKLPVDVYEPLGLDLPLRFRGNGRFRLHHPVEPAVTLWDGTQAWYRHGLLHRESGPAIIRPPPAWLNGAPRRRINRSFLASDLIWAWEGAGFHIHHLDVIPDVPTTKQIPMAWFKHAAAGGLSESRQIQLKLKYHIVDSHHPNHLR